MSQHRIQIDGVEWAYEERGRGDPALVLLHGFTGCWQDFEGPLDELSASRRVVIPELPGHGRSARLPIEEYSLERLTEFLIGFLDRVAQGPCHLVGHSMGGMLSVRVALQAPERLASLVLMDTSADRLGFVDRDVIELAARTGREAGMERLAEIMRERAADDPNRSAADRRVEAEWGEERFWRWRDERVAAMDPEAYGALGVAMADAGNLEGRLAEIACATLVLCGDQDEPFLAPSRTMAEKIPRAKLAWIPGAGHQPQNENPTAWLEAMQAHLARAAEAA